ncbi:MAG: Crp/Fnr family transcriptional regulator [Gammaproteobacteria bacterium]
MKKSEKQLLEVFRKLSETDQQAIQNFSEFLLERNGAVEEKVAAEPLEIQRPSDESVMAAIKRLTRTYPMINKDHMLNETSSLVAQHIIQGKDAIEVIDELEIVFRRHYELTKQGE